MNKITEKKLKNKRFGRTESAIITALLIAKDKLSLGRIICTARISRSTLHRHHGNINEIVPNYEAYILRKWKRTAARLTKLKPTSLKFLYERLLLFLLVHHQIIELLLKYDDHTFVERLIIVLRPKVLTTSKITNDEIFTLYVKEIAGLIEMWCQNGFDTNATPSTVDKIIYLTDTARIRLSPLASFDPPQPVKKLS